MKKILRILAVTLVLSLWCIPGVHATIVTLSDVNSTASINADSSAGSGMYSWTVDGVNLMYQQWFWYRVGGTGGEAPINAISAATVSTFLGTRGLDLTYQNANLSVEVTYMLTGGTAGSKTSDIAETIRINNLSQSSLALHFFQYSDFDLPVGGPAGDTVQMNPTKVDQINPTVALAETVVTPPASEYEAALFNSILSSLTDGSPTTLTNTVDSFTGDQTWAYQWDVTIAPGDTFLISKDKRISPVPEPSVLLLLGAGLVGLGILRKKIVNSKL